MTVRLPFHHPAHNYFKRSLSYSGAVLWNSLPLDIRQSGPLLMNLNLSWRIMILMVALGKFILLLYTGGSKTQVTGHWALSIRPKLPEWISGNFHGRMVQTFPVWKWQAAQFCSLGIFQWLRGLNRKYTSKQNTDKSTSWLFIDHNSRDLNKQQR